MAEKVKVSREVAEGLRRLFASNKKDYPDEEILRLHYESKYQGKHWTGDWWKHVNKLTLAEMAQALYVGYEIEETPEEYLSQVYKNHLERPSCQPAWNDGFADGIKRALEILGIPIEGIND